jgi:hypothetical protein
MADHLDSALRAAIASLTDVVKPAVDEDNPLATEQLGLVIDWLEFLRGRLPLAAAREAAVLQSNREMAAAVLKELQGSDKSVGAQLREALSVADELADSGGIATGYHGIGKVNDALTDALSHLVRGLDSVPSDVRLAIESAVVDGTQHTLDIQRSWFLPLSPEPDPQAVPTLDQLFGTI